LNDARELVEKKQPPPESLEFYEGLSKIYKDAMEVVKGLETEEERHSVYAQFVERLEKFVTQEGKWEHHAVKTLAKRALKYMHELFTFIRVPEVEPTNNIAERALRPAVRQRKIWGCFRTTEGAKNRDIMMSVIGTMKIQNKDFFTAGVFKKSIDQIGSQNQGRGGKRSTGVKYMLIKESLESGSQISVNRATQLLGVSRCGFYKWLGQSKTGQVVNHKRVLRLMREDNLLCVRKDFKPRTTDSRHDLRVYPNLVKGLKITRLNQVWASDITYIRLSGEFVYLAVILDLFSRKCIGWNLDRSLHTELALKALAMAIETRWNENLRGLIHHSDQGVQYASEEYIGCLKAHGILISMSARGNPYDNAFVESFIRTLKYEEVYLNEHVFHPRASFTSSSLILPSNLVNAFLKAHSRHTAVQPSSQAPLSSHSPYMSYRFP